MFHGVGKWSYDLQLLNDRAGPSVSDDYRKSVRILRANMDEVNVDTVDVRHELRIRIEFRLGLPPVVILCPIVGEFLHRRELNALRRISDRFLLRPTRRRDAFEHVRDRFFRNVDVEGADCFARRPARQWDFAPPPLQNSRRGRRKERRIRR